MRIGYPWISKGSLEGIIFDINIHYILQEKY